MDWEKREEGLSDCEFTRGLLGRLDQAMSRWEKQLVEEGASDI